MKQFWSTFSPAYHEPFAPEQTNLTLNPFVLSPGEVATGDQAGYKIIASVYLSHGSDGGFWAAYKGPTTWSDDDVAGQGDKIPEAVARELFPCFQHLRYNR